MVKLLMSQKRQNLFNGLLSRYANNFINDHLRFQNSHGVELHFYRGNLGELM